MFSLNRITSPRPDPLLSPAIIDANEMFPDKYNSVKRTDDAQFGIRPIKLAIIG